MLATINGEIAGAAKTHQHAERDGHAPAGHYLGGVVVGPQWRRQGVGSLLTKARLEWIWQRSDRAFYFTNEHNDASIELHRRFGFIPIFTGPTIRGVPADSEGGSPHPLRSISAGTSVTGLPQSIPEPAITTLYDNTTGNVTGTTSTAGTTAMTYDTWGRQLTYTTTGTGPAEATTTTYNQLGDVSKVTTPKGVTDLVWDGTDAAGDPETRGLLTKVTNNVNGYQSVATAAYDAHGELVLERLPGKISRETMFDLTGELISQTYNGTITDPDTGTTTDNQPWVAWSIGANAAGQITREWNPEGGAAIDGATTGTQPESADLRYTYDKAGRLTTVTDRITATPTSVATCDKRTYGFDQRGNRTTHTTATDPGQDCTTLTETSNVTRSYDIADHPLEGANGQGTYTYDPLGRQTVIPAADAPNPADGDIGIEYRDSDAARRIHQGDTTIQYDLDGSGRRAAQTSYTGGTLTTPGPETSKTTNHYTDASDNPGWITHDEAGQTATTVYGNLVSDDLSLSITTDTAGTQGELALTTPRGDIAATITLPTAATSATGLDSWTRYTEYGNPTTTPPAGTTGTAGNGYGWLGAHQRTTTNIGLTLMGARLYNPTTGLFTSTDPIYGGNETDFGYPNDPINKQDTSGERQRWHKRLARWLVSSRTGKLLNTACGFSWGWAAVGCTVVYAGAHAALGNRRAAAKTVAQGVAAAVGGRVARVAVARVLGKGSRYALPRRAKG